jgi:hypothetical protein
MSFLRTKYAVAAAATVVGGCLVLVAASTAVASPEGAVAHASTLQVSRATPRLKCARLLKVFLPPAGVKPLTESAVQLREKGFPPRPSNVAAGALSAWVNAMRHVKRFTVPHPVCSSARHGAHLADLWNGIWVGYGYLAKDFGNGSDFNETSGEWVQPTVGNNSKYTNYQDAPDASFWNGLGGLNWKVTSPDVIQAGCDSISTSTAQYRCWTEDYPLGTDWEGPVVRPGDTVYVSVLYVGDSEASYYIENVTTGDVQSFENSAPYESDNTAEWVSERVNGLYYPNYGSAPMDDNYAYTESAAYGLANANAYNITMTTNCESTGSLLAETTGLSDTDFTIYTVASSPYCNSGGLN